VSAGGEGVPCLGGRLSEQHRVWCIPSIELRELGGKVCDVSFFAWLGSGCLEDLI